VRPWSLFGDFNTIAEDHPHPIKSVLDNKANPHRLIDVHEAYAKDHSISIADKRAQPIGTYFFAAQMQWNVLDRFLVSENLFNQKGLKISLADYRIHATAVNTQDYHYRYRDNFHFGSVIRGTPWASSTHATGSHDAGYSDHFPVVAKFYYSGR
jgi:endonuclease/exonuclease/phosphatase family metal-dependent hydrolase